MRQVFYLVLTLLVLQMFFPLVSGALGETLLSVIETADAVVDQANTQLSAL